MYHILRIWQPPAEFSARFSAVNAETGMRRYNDCFAVIIPYFPSCVIPLQNKISPNSLAFRGLSFAASLLPSPFVPSTEDSKKFHFSLPGDTLSCCHPPCAENREKFYCDFAGTIKLLPVFPPTIFSHIPAGSQQGSCGQPPLPSVLLHLPGSLTLPWYRWTARLPGPL